MGNNGCRILIHKELYSPRGWSDVSPNQKWNDPLKVVIQEAQHLGKHVKRALHSWIVPKTVQFQPSNTPPKIEVIQKHKIPKFSKFYKSDTRKLMYL